MSHTAPKQHLPPPTHLRQPLSFISFSLRLSFTLPHTNHIIPHSLHLSYTPPYITHMHPTPTPLLHTSLHNPHIHPHAIHLPYTPPHIRPIPPYPPHLPTPLPHPSDLLTWYCWREQTPPVPPLGRVAMLEAREAELMVCTPPSRLHCSGGGEVEANDGS